MASSLALPRAFLAAGAAPSPLISPAKPSFSSFHPGIAIIIGVLTTVFSLTFLLLLYAKHCKRDGENDAGMWHHWSAGYPASSTEKRNSGVERVVVESLPVFRFGSLSGQKEGLECAVCLNPFEQAEVLRLLPKCRHAFHVECVDTWLDAHSTCPLCRFRVDPEDVLLLPPPPLPPPPPEKSKFSNPFGRLISSRHSSAGEKSSRRSVGSAENRSNRRSVDCRILRQQPASRKDELLPVAEPDRDRFEHRIVVSTGGEPDAAERWSDLRPSDIMFLRSEMIITDSGRFSTSKTARIISSSTMRTASEITGVSRFPTAAVGEERTLRRWLSFGGKRTARWLQRPSGGG